MSEWAFHPLTAERWEDFVALFSQHGVQNGCWCTYWRLTRQQFHHEYYGEKSKQLMHSIVQSGRPPGLLAYCDGKPAGWICVAPREEFPALDRSPKLKRVDGQPVWSIVCFFIAEDQRAAGLSRRLVQAAVDYARTQGAKLLEAYPNSATHDHCLPPERYMGVRSTFEKAGFRLAAERGGRHLVMRLELKPESIPDLRQALPDLMSLALSLAWRYQQGRLLAEQLHQEIANFFSDEVMARIEQTLPGWMAMASYAHGQTLVHTACMLVATLASPEYALAGDEDQRVLEWIAVLHDLGKQATDLQRDHAHAFRSAALAGRILPGLGFPPKPGYVQVIDGWSQLTRGAVVLQEAAVLQDNRCLPEILGGIERMFGKHSPAARVIECTLLHMSLDTVPEWPCPAGLAIEHARQLIDPQLLPLLTATMLADSDAWNLFNQPIKERYRKMTLEFVQNAWPEHKIGVQ